MLFRSRDVEKSGTGFQRVNEYCTQQNVEWTFRKEAYGFFFEFVRTNGQTVVQTIVQTENEISASERMVLDIIRNNEGLSKAEIASRIGKSERSAQRIISSLIKKKLLEPQGANQSRTWRIKE